MAEVKVETVMMMIQIIDLASKNGTFVGEDISTAGNVRKELVDIVQPIIDQAKQEEDALKEEAAAAQDGE